MLPPADRQIAAEGLAVIQVGPDHGCFQVQAKFHIRGPGSLCLLFLRKHGFLGTIGTKITFEFLKSKVSR